jgi:anhydro-N-acetylmuramic acid kinase
MFYRAIGLMSGSSMDGLDIVFAEFTEQSGKWQYEIRTADCYPFEEAWITRLKNATSLSAYDYLLLHTSFGKYIGEQVNKFIDTNGLHHQVQLIASHGHTVFHAPHIGMTAQLGDGAAIAATTGINVVSDLRAVDVALGGQGAPIVPMGEKLLLGDYPLLLNIGGIANISYRSNDGYIAFDICPANRVLNMLTALQGKPYDANGEMASGGNVLEDVLAKLNALDYYQQPSPKSLANQFGTDEVFPLMPKENIADALRTYVEHIAVQIRSSIENLSGQQLANNEQLLITGGGAHNSFLVQKIRKALEPLGISVVVPGKDLVDYKEALIMALLGILRWREQNTVLASVTGAKRDSIGGAVWIGQDA